MSRSGWAIAFGAVLVMSCTAGAASAADLGGNCCADLEQRIAELEASSGRQGILALTGFVGGQPQYVVIDPTSFALENDALRYIGAGIANVLSQSLYGPPANAPFTPAGQMNLGAGPSGAVDGSSAAEFPETSSGFWGSAIGGTAEYDGDDLSETDNEFAGGIGGAHFRFAPGLVAGAFAGGASNLLETERGKRIDTDYVLGGIYGRAVYGSMFVDASLTGGHSQSSSTRQIVSTVPGAPVFQTARGDYDGTFLLPVARLGAQLPVGGGTVFIPAVQVRYIWQRFDGYEERGSSVNLEVGDRTLQSFEERFELGIRQSFGTANGQAVTLHAAAGAVLYQRTGDRDIEIGVFGTTSNADPGGEDTEAGGFARAGFSIGLAPGVDLFGEAEASRTEESASVTGSAGLKAKF